MMTKRTVVPRRFGDAGQLFRQVHYDLVARALVKAHQRTGYSDTAREERLGIDRVREELINMFLEDDPAFNVNRFSDRVQPLLSAIANDARVAGR